MSYPFFIIPIIMVIVIFYISYSSKVTEREMTMIIISKDKTKCAEYNRLTVQRNFGNGKDKKFAIFGSVNQHSDVLNSYPTKEAAVKELEKIYAAYQNGDKTYAL